MRVFRFLPACSAVLGVAFASLPAFAQNAALTPHIEARATWDDRFIYFAFVIDDTDLLGTNIKPMSEATADDSIGGLFPARRGPSPLPPTICLMRWLSQRRGLYLSNGRFGDKSLQAAAPFQHQVCRLPCREL